MNDRAWRLVDLCVGHHVVCVLFPQGVYECVPSHVNAHQAFSVLVERGLERSHAEPLGLALVCLCWACPIARRVAGLPGVFWFWSCVCQGLNLLTLFEAAADKACRSPNAQAADRALTLYSLSGANPFKVVRQLTKVRSVAQCLCVVSPASSAFLSHIPPAKHYSFFGFVV